MTSAQHLRCSMASSPSSSWESCFKRLLRKTAGEKVCALAPNLSCVEAPYIHTHMHIYCFLFFLLGGPSVIHPVRAAQQTKVSTREVDILSHSEGWRLPHPPPKIISFGTPQQNGNRFEAMKLHWYVITSGDGNDCGTSHMVAEVNQVFRFWVLYLPPRRRAHSKSHMGFGSKK